MAARSTACFCGRLFAAIVCVNPAEGIYVVFCECCVMLGGGLCDGPIICPEESYRLWCDREAP